MMRVKASKAAKGGLGPGRPTRRMRHRSVRGRPMLGTPTTTLRLRPRRSRRARTARTEPVAERRSSGSQPPRSPAQPVERAPVPPAARVVVLDEFPSPDSASPPGGSRTMSDTHSDDGDDDEYGPIRIEGKGPCAPSWSGGADEAAAAALRATPKRSARGRVRLAVSPTSVSERVAPNAAHGGNGHASGSGRVGLSARSVNTSATSARSGVGLTGTVRRVDAHCESSCVGRGHRRPQAAPSIVES